MLEVDEDLSFGSELSETLGKGSDLGGAVSSAAAQAIAGVALRALDLRRAQIVALGDAQSGIVRAQDGIDLVAEPRLVSEFERNSRCSGAGQCRCEEEICE